MKELNILISSAGRRNYLVQWFRDALNRNDVSGSVVASDSDIYAPSQADADEFFVLPPVESEHYRDALLDLCRANRISLAVSVNDFELSRWAAMDKAAFETSGIRLISLQSTFQSLVEDKYEMSSALKNEHVLVPQTYIAGDVLADGAIRAELGDSIVIKNRFGSGSSGLIFSTSGSLDRDIETALRSARNELGESINSRSEALKSVVVQPRIVGDEFGMDVLSDFRATYSAVFVRRKLSMRGGETDKATSEEPTRFESLAREIARVIPHIGVVDLDVMEDSAGRRWVIDVNPRFGGGYPFSHVAGADAPSAYVAWALGRTPEHSWLDYSVGVVGAKHQSIALVSGSVDR